MWAPHPRPSPQGERGEQPSELIPLPQAPRPEGRGEPRATGGCLCGAVRYEVRGGLRPVVACHCTQCRRMTGHFLAATAAREGDLAITRGSTLKWYSASAHARRGFCGDCGSTLFWHGTDRDYVAIAAGSIDGKKRYRSSFRWASRELQDGFSEAVIAAVEAEHGPLGAEAAL